MRTALLDHDKLTKPYLFFSFGKWGFIRPKEACPFWGYGSIAEALRILAIAERFNLV